VQAETQVRRRRAGPRRLRVEYDTQAAKQSPQFIVNQPVAPRGRGLPE